MERRVGGFVYAVALSPDCTYCAFAGTNKAVIVLDGRTGVPTWRVAAPGAVWTVALLEAGAGMGPRMAVGGECPTVTVYDLATKRDVLQLPVEETTFAIAITPESLCYTNGTAASMYGKGGTGYSWRDPPSFAVMASLITTSLLSEELLLHCASLVVEVHPAVVNSRDKDTGASLLQFVISHANHPKLLAMLLGVSCSIGLQADARGRTCLHAALEQASRSACPGKWRSLQQLLDALQRKRFSIIPGAMRLVAECLEGIATDYPLDFLHYVTHLPLDPEPEVLGDVDAFDVMLPSVLLCGSSHRCPKGIWDAKLQQYSRSNAHGDWDGDSGVVPDAFAPPGKARKTVRRASTERRSSAEITPGSRETASDVVGMRRGSCCGPAAGNMRRRTCCDSAAGKHRTASLTRATAAAVSVARHSHSCDRLPSTRTSEKRCGSAAGAVEQLNKPTPSAGLRQLQTVHSSSFMESEQGGGANEPSSPVTGDDLPPTPVEKVVEMGYTKVSRGGLQACRVPLENFAGVMQAADGNDSHAVSLLQLVVDAVDTTLDYSVFGARLMQMLVEFKWHGFAKDAFQRTLFWYVVHMIVVIVFNLHAAFTLDWSMDDVLGRSAYSDDLGNAAESPDGYVHGRPNVLLLLGLAWTSVQCVHTGLNEIWQLRVSGRRAYFRSFWNHFDLLYVFGQGAINVIFCLRDSVPTWLIIDFAPNATEAADAEAATSRRRLFLRGSSALHGWHDAAPYRYDDDPYGRTPTHPLRLLRAASSNTAGSEDGETGYAIGAFVYLQSLVCLGICIRLIHFFRGSLRLGALAHTLGAIAVDILPLLSLLAVFVVAFCLATMVVLIHECTSEVYGEWHNPFDALLVMLNIGLYTYYNSSVFKPERRFLLLIYQFYMILVQVILLNMLIAVMSESHNRVTTQAELVALHGRAKLILEYETEELERQKSHKERRGGTGATVGATALRGWMARLDPRQLLDDTAQEERMQRVCPRWLHVLMPAEHQRGDKAVEGEELKQLKELRARVEGVADDLGAQQRQLLDALSKHDPQEQQQQLAKQLASLREDLLGAPGPTGGTPAPGSLGRRQSYVLGV